MQEVTRRIVVGHPDALMRAEMGFQLCRVGWETHTAATGPEARRLTCRWRPELVILASEFADESGWLTCAKLSHERPGLQIILMDTDLSPTDRRFARFSGATRVVSDRRGMADLLDAVSATPGVSAAC